MPDLNFACLRFITGVRRSVAHTDFVPPAEFVPIFAESGCGVCGQKMSSRHTGKLG